MNYIGWVILGVVVVIIGWVIGLYNALVKLKNRVDEAWSDIDVQLKRRYDLIPNLVETVKGYASHEAGTFEKVTKARTDAMNQNDAKDADPAKMAAAENMLSSTLKSIFALAENYPELKANTNFSQLQSELSDTENKIQAARRFYNGMVRDYNIKIETFPNNMVAGMLKYGKREYFEAEGEHERQNVEVKF